MGGVDGMYMPGVRILPIERRLRRRAGQHERGRDVFLRSLDRRGQLHGVQCRAQSVCGELAEQPRHGDCVPTQCVRLERFLLHHHGHDCISGRYFRVPAPAGFRNDGDDVRGHVLPSHATSAIELLRGSRQWW